MGYAQGWCCLATPNVLAALVVRSQLKLPNQFLSATNLWFLEPKSAVCPTPAAGFFHSLWYGGTSWSKTLQDQGGDGPRMTRGRPAALMDTLGARPTLAPWCCQRLAQAHASKAATEPRGGSQERELQPSQQLLPLRSFGATAERPKGPCSVRTVLPPRALRPFHPPRLRWQRAKLSAPARGGSPCGTALSLQQPGCNSQEVSAGEQNHR